MHPINRNNKNVYIDFGIRKRAIKGHYIMTTLSEKALSMVEIHLTSDKIRVCRTN